MNEITSRPDGEQHRRTVGTWFIVAAVLLTLVSATTAVLWRWAPQWWPRWTMAYAPTPDLALRAYAFQSLSDDGTDLEDGPLVVKRFGTRRLIRQARANECAALRVVDVLSGTLDKDGNDQAVLDALSELSHDRDPAVRRAIAGLTVTAGDEESVVNRLVLALADDPHPQVAAVALTRIVRGLGYGSSTEQETGIVTALCQRHLDHRSTIASDVLLGTASATTLEVDRQYLILSGRERLPVEPRPTIDAQDALIRAMALEGLAFTDPPTAATWIDEHGPQLRTSGRLGRLIADLADEPWAGPHALDLLARHAPDAAAAKTAVAAILSQMLSDHRSIFDDVAESSFSDRLRALLVEPAHHPEAIVAALRQALSAVDPAKADSLHAIVADACDSPSLGDGLRILDACGPTLATAGLRETIAGILVARLLDDERQAEHAAVPELLIRLDAATGLTAIDDTLGQPDHPAETRERLTFAREILSGTTEAAVLP